MVDIQEILFANSERLKEAFLINSFDKSSLILYCVNNSTIRAFQKRKGYYKKFKPLSIFRSWAFKYLEEGTFLMSIKSHLSFEELHKATATNLINYWKNVDGGNPEFYHYHKLIDLLFKCLPLWNKIDSDSQNWLFNNVNVPLDKFSLNLLNQCVPTLNIPKNASMNFVNSTNYPQLQNTISNICSGYPPILFDLYAWDEEHRKNSRFGLIPIEKDENFEI